MGERPMEGQGRGDLASKPQIRKGRRTGFTRAIGLVRGRRMRTAGKKERDERGGDGVLLNIRSGRRIGGRGEELGSGLRGLGGERRKKTRGKKPPFFTTSQAKIQKKQYDSRDERRREKTKKGPDSVHKGRRRNVTVEEYHRSAAEKKGGGEGGGGGRGVLGGCSELPLRGAVSEGHAAKI